MIHLQKKIRDALQKEFDKNTKGINFEVSLYNTKSNANLTKEYDIENTYHTEQKRYVPIIIQDIFGDYVPIENSTILEGNITSTMLIPTESEDINETLISEHTENILEALDEIRMNNTGKSTPVGDIQHFVPESQISYSPSILNGIRLKGRFIADGLLASFGDSYTFELTKEDGLLTMYTIEGDNTRTPRVSLSLDDKPRQIIAYTKSIAGNNIFCELIVDSARKTAAFFSETQFSETQGMSLTNKLMLIESLQIFNAEDVNISSTLAQLKTYIDSMSGIYIKEFSTGENLEQVAGYNYEIIGEPFASGAFGSIQLEFSVPNPSTNVFTFANGLNYQEFLLSWGLTYSDNVFNGNDIKYFLDGIRIYPTHRSSGVASIQNSAQKINATTSKTINEENVMSKDFTLYWDYSPKTLELFEYLTDLNIEQNKVFKLKEKYPLFTREYDVIITEGGFSPTMNTPIQVSISVALAEDILE